MAKLEMTREALSPYFNYRHDSGQLFWNLDRPRQDMRPQAYGAWKKACSGRLAGTVSHKGKRVVRLSGHTYQVARIIVALDRGSIQDSEEVSFLDDNPLNTSLENIAVYASGDCNPKSGVKKTKGIHWNGIDGDFFREHIRYDPLTGKLWFREDAPRAGRALAAHRRWVKRFGGAEIAASDKDGYTIFSLFGRTYRAHRAIMAMTMGRLPDGLEVDHINGVRDDNRLSNLRAVDRQTNARNAGMNSRNTSGHVGVYWKRETSMWAAAGGCDGRVYPLGTYDTLGEAVSARKEWQRKVGGFTERHGRGS